MTDHLKPYQFKKGDSRCKGKTATRKSALDTCDALGFDPLEFEILVAQDQWKLLGLKGSISIAQRLKASQHITDKVYPTLKAVELKEDFNEAEDERVVVIMPSNGRELESEIKQVTMQESVSLIPQDQLLDMARKVDLPIGDEIDEL